MKKTKLGLTGLTVSRICFGAGWIYDLSHKEGSSLLMRAYRSGMNFWDTSNDYGSHPHVARALKNIPRSDIILSTKTYARTFRGARASLRTSLKELGTSYVDIFFLHWIRGLDHLKKSKGALEAIAQAKRKGLVKAAGVSTHSVKVVRACADMPQVDVIMAPLNKSGSYIEHGSVSEMRQALRKACLAGKGICLIKAFGGGELADDIRSRLEYCLKFPHAHSVCLGIRNADELRTDADILRRFR